MKTIFQQSFLIEDAKAIVKILHPELIDNELKNFRMYAKYTWMVIDFRVKGYGIVDIGINNHNQYGLFGAGITKNDIKQHLSEGKIKWRIWRMCLDKRYEEYKQDAESSGIYQYEDVLHKEVYNILESKYKLPSVEEFYKNYYSD